MNKASNTRPTSRRGKRRREIITETGLHIPRHEIETMTRALLPDMLTFFESEEGKQEFEEWEFSLNTDD